MLERVYAAVNTTPVNPLDGTVNNLSDIFGLAINVIIGIAVSLAVIFIGMGGIQYITARGDTKAADAARTSITNAVIGLVIALAALAVKAIVLNILDADTDVGGNIII